MHANHLGFRGGRIRLRSLGKTRSDARTKTHHGQHSRKTNPNSAAPDAAKTPAN